MRTDDLASLLSGSLLHGKWDQTKNIPDALAGYLSNLNKNVTPINLVLRDGDSVLLPTLKC